MFIRYLFAGKTMAQAYEAYFDFNVSSVERYVHLITRPQAMWLDKNC